MVRAGAIRPGRGARGSVGVLDVGRDVDGSSRDATLILVGRH